jgi:hypothetical protein
MEVAWILLTAMNLGLAVPRAFLTPITKYPIVMAGIIVVLSAVVGVAAYDPDMPEAERDRRSKEYFQKEAEQTQRAEQQRLDDLWLNDWLRQPR